MCYSSPDVYVGNWTYESLEKLAIGGIIGLSGLDTKPMTRIQVAYKIKEAMDNIDEERLPDRLAMDREYVEYLQTLLYRLINEYRQELVRIGATAAQLDSKKDDWLSRNIDLNTVSPIETELRFVSVKARRDLLLENENGLRLAEGFNVRARAYPWANAFNTVTFSARPALRFADNVSQVYMDEAAAKFSLANIELSGAKSARWWGPGYHGAMLLSNNAQPLSLVRLRTVNNFSFPGVFKKLGTFGGNFFVSKLDRDRKYEAPNFMGLRLEWSPAPYLALGATRTDICGGKGRPRLRAKDYWKIFVGGSKDEFTTSGDIKRTDTDQLASLDAKLAIPLGYSFIGASGIEVYGEWAGEDRFSFWENESPGFLAGFFLTDLFREEGTDFRFEYAKNKPAWYKHGIYNTDNSEIAYSYKSTIMGHHMGPDADDMFFRISKEMPFLHTPYFNSVKAGLQLDAEQHGLSQPTKEGLLEITLDVLWQHSDTTALTLSYEFEDYKNYGHVSGKTAKNHIITSQVEIKF